MKDLVSIIIATLNAQSFLAKALDSIQNQTHTLFEVIIVDGGSDDLTLEI